MNVNIKVNLKTKTLTANRIAVIKNAKLDPKAKIDPKKDLSLTEIERLYQVYKHSVPSENTRDSRYFKALPLEELSDEDLKTNTDRKTAKEALEICILLSVITRSIEWQSLAPDQNHWFWQSKNDPDLILLRDWFLQNPKT